MAFTSNVGFDLLFATIGLLAGLTPLFATRREQVQEIIILIASATLASLLISWLATHFLGIEFGLSFTRAFLMIGILQTIVVRVMATNESPVAKG